jgi:hypothetical protein
MATNYLTPSATRSAHFLLVVCFIIIILLRVCWPSFSRGRFEQNYRTRLPLTPPDGCRLCCIGAPEQLAVFGEWKDVAFQPALFFGKFVIRGRGVPGWLFDGIAVLAFLAVLGLGFRGFVGVFEWALVPVFVADVGLTDAVTSLLWPTYLRLVPGRLDVLGYSPFSRKPNFYHGYDLRDAQITVDLRRSFVSIASPRGKLEFGIALMRERRYFAYMLFLAAMSTHQPGPVPEDELLG